MPIRPILSCLATLLLIALAAPVAAAPAPLPPADARDLRCAAAFAVVAVAQARGDAAAATLPPLAIRGRQFMGAVGARLTAGGTMTPAAVQAELTNAARALTLPGAITAARGCLATLDQITPPRPVLDAVACEALLGVYAEVLGARDAADPRAAALQRDADALSRSASAALAARGTPAEAQPAAKAAARARLREALLQRSDTITADEFTHCRRMAAATR